MAISRDTGFSTDWAIGSFNPSILAAEIDGLEIFSTGFFLTFLSFDNGFSGEAVFLLVFTSPFFTIFDPISISSCLDFL
ncbi:hypothetical protein MASR2M66_16900 [Chloroflexota bacterium]